MERTPKEIPLFEEDPKRFAEEIARCAKAIPNPEVSFVTDEQAEVLKGCAAILQVDYEGIVWEVDSTLRKDLVVNALVMRMRTLDQIEAWLAKVYADPVKLASLDELL